MPTWKFPPFYASDSRLALETALDRIPFFRTWRKYDPGPSHPVDRRFAALPAFSKSDIRRHFPQDLLPPEANLEEALQRGEIALVQTSGTTDDKVTNIWNQKWWDDSEHSSWSLNSHLARFANGNHKEAILVNPRNVGFLSDEIDLSLEKRRLERFLYLNEKSDTVAWSSAHMQRMVQEINSFQPEVLEANPSMLAKLSRHISARGQAVFQPGIITFTYEYPTRLHLSQIGEVFSAPLVSSYGTTETGYVFVQCESGLMHQNTEYCRVDFQPFKAEHGGPSRGRILVTPFHNPWNYMLRFDVGDVVTLAGQARCACGRQGMLLSSIDGRKTNLTVTCQGRLVTLGELDRVLSELPGIAEYQVSQVEKTVYRLCLVATTTRKKELSDRAGELLRQIYGREAEVSVIFQKAVAPEVSGKYQLARTLFPITIEDYLDPGCLPH